MRKLLWIVLLALGILACAAEEEEVSPLVENPAPKAPKVIEETVGTEISHEDEVLEWQQQRSERLLAEDGWLSLVGLHWLVKGENRFGSGEDNEIVLGADSSPDHAGTLVLERAEGVVTVRLEPAEGAEITVADKPVNKTLDVFPDSPDGPIIMKMGSLSFLVIQRGERFGLRVKDTEAPTRINFHGLEYFPIKESWRIKARFEPYDPPLEIPIVNIIGGDPIDELSPGAIVFEKDGKTFRLDALDGGEDELFIIFADLSTGVETYGAGRYLYTPRPDQKGRVTIDFNRAYNPPCAFTAFATCPLPPKQNRLNIHVDAGELAYHFDEPEPAGTK